MALVRIYDPNAADGQGAYEQVSLQVDIAVGDGQIKNNMLENGSIDEYKIAEKAISGSNIKEKTITYENINNSAVEQFFKTIGALQGFDATSKNDVITNQDTLLLALEKLQAQISSLPQTYVGAAQLGTAIDNHNSDVQAHASLFAATKNASNLNTGFVPLTVLPNIPVSKLSSGNENESLTIDQNLIPTLSIDKLPNQAYWGEVKQLTANTTVKNTFNNTTYYVKSSGLTLTIPIESTTTNFTNGMTFSLVSWNGSTINISFGDGVYVLLAGKNNLQNSTLQLQAFGMCGIQKIATNSWIVSGNVIQI